MLWELSMNGDRLHDAAGQKADLPPFCTYEQHHRDSATDIAILIKSSAIFSSLDMSYSHGLRLSLRKRFAYPCLPISSPWYLFTSGTPGEVRSASVAPALHRRFRPHG